MSYFLPEGTLGFQPMRTPKYTLFKTHDLVFAWICLNCRSLFAGVFQGYADACVNCVVWQPACVLIIPPSPQGQTSGIVTA